MLYVGNILCSGHQTMRKHHQKLWMEMAIVILAIGMN
jgi:hypothetical protein